VAFKLDYMRNNFKQRTVQLMYCSAAAILVKEAELEICIVEQISYFSPTVSSHSLYGGDASAVIVS
jgi:hypothetical protein